MRKNRIGNKKKKDKTKKQKDKIKMKTNQKPKKIYWLFYEGLY